MNGLRGRQKGRYCVRTTDSKKVPSIAPNQMGGADIPYIQTGEGWLYLAGVLDPPSRKIVGGAMRDYICAMTH